MTPAEAHNRLATDFVMMAGEHTRSQAELLVVVESTMLATMMMLVRIHGEKPANASVLLEAALQNATERFSRRA